MKYKFIKIKDYPYLLWIDNIRTYDTHFIKYVAKGIGRFVYNQLKKGKAPIGAIPYLIKQTHKDRMDILNNNEVILAFDNQRYFTYHSGIIIEDTIIKDNINYPALTIKDIHIEKYEHGKHYYPFVGNLHIIDDGVDKWNTYDYAYSIALKHLHD